MCSHLSFPPPTPMLFKDVAPESPVFIFHQIRFIC